MMFRVLVVDDGETNRQVLKKILTFRLKIPSCDIEEAEDGIDCLEKLSKTIFNLILMDIEMPRLNGIETSKIISTVPKNVANLASFAADTSFMDYDTASAAPSLTPLSRNPSMGNSAPSSISLSRNSSLHSQTASIGGIRIPSPSLSTEPLLNLKVSTKYTSTMVQSPSPTAFQILSSPASLIDSDDFESDVSIVLDDFPQSWVLGTRMLEENKNIPIIAVTSATNNSNIKGVDSTCYCVGDVLIKNGLVGVLANGKSDCAKCNTLEKHCERAGMFAVVRKPVTSRESMSLLLELTKQVMATCSL